MLQLSKRKPKKPADDEASPIDSVRSTSTTSSILAELLRIHAEVDREDEPPPMLAPHELTKLQSTALTAILEMCVDQLALIGMVLPQADTRVDLSYKTMEEKFSIEHNTRLYDPRTLQSYAEAEKQLETVKFQKDRGRIQMLLDDAAQDLKESNSFKNLLDRIKIYEKEMEEEEELFVQVDVKKEKLGDLRLLVEDERAAMTAQLRLFTENAGKLRDEYEEQLVVSGVERKYMDKWELARVEANKYALEFTETNFADAISDYTTRFDKEERDHVEIVKYLEEQQIELQEQTEIWMDRYEREVEAKDTEILMLREKKEISQQKMEYLLDAYNDHKIKIDEYMKLKDQRLKQRQEEFRRSHAASKIQAWWRGIMVRKGLGPYRKKHKKNKKDKKKKK